MNDILLSMYWMVRKSRFNSPKKYKKGRGVIFWPICVCTTVLNLFRNCLLNLFLLSPFLLILSLEVLVHSPCCCGGARPSIDGGKNCGGISISGDRIAAFVVVVGVNVVCVCNGEDSLQLCVSSSLYRVRTMCVVLAG